MTVCSQWGVHPHEVAEPHEADGWMDVDLRANGNGIEVDVPICARCVWEVVENYGAHHDDRLTVILFRGDVVYDSPRWLTRNVALNAVNNEMEERDQDKDGEEEDQEDEEHDEEDQEG